MRIKLTALLVGAMFYMSQGTVFAEMGGKNYSRPDRQSYRSESRSESRSEKKAKEHSWQGVAGDLDLSDKQKEKLKEHKDKGYKERVQLRSSMQIKQHDLRSELSNKEIDKKKVDNLIDEIAGLHKKQLQLRTGSLLEFKEILTEEQWDTIRERKQFGAGGENKKHMR
ncbi:MAG: periplasmic heavy metal sensor [Elusimicrobia bacterium]|jgi:Spy/CpxP family protein refolding chaperone|nr:periplasmic heavy metal sensor [Elusimicrobiota bacterium]